MELLFVELIAIAIGFAAQALLPGREFRGVVVLPALAGAVSAIVWVTLTWLHWKWDGGWIWVATFLITAAAVVVAGVVARGVRREADAKRFEVLSRAA